MVDKFVKIDDIPAGELPPEVADAVRNLLLVENRVQFPLKPTVTSAVSTIGDEIPADEDPLTRAENVVNDVKDMEDLIEQLEDSVDQLTKDMKIPASSPRISDAIKRLGGDDPNNITKDVFDTALGIVDNWPLIALGQDPVLGGLIGDGTLEGPWEKCNQLGNQFSELVTVAAKKDYDGETVIKNQSVKASEEFEGNMLKMILHILKMFWWNMIWAKFIVDLIIINPARQLVANPIDGILLFFKKFKYKGTKYKRFKKKPQSILLLTGPINNFLTQLRKFLLCTLPNKPQFGIDGYYDPLVEIDCPPEPPCVSEPQPNEGSEEVDEIEKASFNMVDDDICINEKDMLKGEFDGGNVGLGASPECLKSSQIVIEVVIADALTPGDSPSTQGIPGTANFQQEQFGL